MTGQGLRQEAAIFDGSATSRPIRCPLTSSGSERTRPQRARPRLAGARLAGRQVLAGRLGSGARGLLLATRPALLRRLLRGRRRLRACRAEHHSPLHRAASCTASNTCCSKGWRRRTRAAQAEALRMAVRRQTPRNTSRLLHGA
jgi:hypothetical protein